MSEGVCGVRYETHPFLPPFRSTPCPTTTSRMPSASNSVPSSAMAAPRPASPPFWAATRQQSPGNCDGDGRETSGVRHLGQCAPAAGGTRTCECALQHLRDRQGAPAPGSRRSQEGLLSRADRRTPDRPRGNARGLCGDHLPLGRGTSEAPSLPALPEGTLPAPARNGCAPCSVGGGTAGEEVDRGTPRRCRGARTLRGLRG